MDVGRRGLNILGLWQRERSPFAHNEAWIPSSLLRCAHGDKVAASEHFARMRTLEVGRPCVRLLLPHDALWYEANKGGLGTIPSLLIL